jgi:cytochrome c oxidase subunit II
MTTHRRAVLIAFAVSVATASACTPGGQSALHPRGPQAGYIWGLSMLFFVVCSAVVVAVAAAVLLAIYRRNRQVITDIPEDGEPGKTRAVAWATALTVLILLVFLGYDLFVGLATKRMPSAGERPITIEAVGHQWWWEFRYVDPLASRSFTTANEIRIPVGRPVILHLQTRDVIHSFWVPNLHGKLDMVPGRTNTTWLQADEPGVYRGQCAEFCGLQHAKMAFFVVAEPEEQFNAWVEASIRPAADPIEPAALAGRDVFLDRQCSLCHTIRGTGAWGKVAPDLTGLGSRLTIAAGILPNTRGNLAGWLVDPQHIKPGSFMPPTNLTGDELHALLTYLEGLK